jgi:hypothetical protein
VALLYSKLVPLHRARVVPAVRPYDLAVRDRAGLIHQVLGVHRLGGRPQLLVLRIGEGETPEASAIRHVRIEADGT